MRASMDATERQEPDRDPVLARKTSRPCAIEDAEAWPTGWARLKRLFRRGRRRREPDPADLPPLEPESIPEPPEELPPNNRPDSF
jgi:hypothetical protein